MPEKVSEVMTRDPRTVERFATPTDVARLMRDDDIGAVVVTVDGRADGIVTDRDIVVRAIAPGLDLDATPIGEIESRDLHTVRPDQTVEDAARVMRQFDIRRVVVVQDERPVGIVSIGDIAIELEPDTELADIASEPPNP